MTTRILTTISIGLGLMGTIASLIWFNKYPDLSQLVLYFGFSIGLVILGLIYESIKRMQDDLKSLEESQDELTLWAENKFKEVKE